jgi:hypothetical protein
MSAKGTSGRLRQVGAAYRKAMKAYEKQMEEYNKKYKKN